MLFRWNSKSLIFRFSVLELVWIQIFRTIPLYFLRIKWLSLIKFRKKFRMGHRTCNENFERTKIIEWYISRVYGQRFGVWSSFSYKKFKINCIIYMIEEFKNSKIYNLIIILYFLRSEEAIMSVQKWTLWSWKKKKV